LLRISSDCCIFINLFGPFHFYRGFINTGDWSGGHVGGADLLLFDVVKALVSPPVYGSFDLLLALFFPRTMPDGAAGLPVLCAPISCLQALWTWSFG